MSRETTERTAAELRGIAERLLQMATDKEAEGTAPGGWGSRTSTQSDPVEVARFLYRGRAERAGYFNAELLGEPAWDMLLDLFIARSTGKEISTTSLCHAARVAQTTGLRWIGFLEDAGLVERIADENDRRVTNVRMSAEAAKRMRNFLKRYSARNTAAPELRLIRSS